MALLDTHYYGGIKEVSVGDDSTGSYINCDCEEGWY